MPTSKKMVSLDMTLLAYLKTYLPGSYEVIDPALYEGKGFNEMEMPDCEDFVIHPLKGGFEDVVDLVEFFCADSGLFTKKVLSKGPQSKVREVAETQAHIRRRQRAAREYRHRLKHIASILVAIIDEKGKSLGLIWRITVMHVDGNIHVHKMPFA